MLTRSALVDVRPFRLGLSVLVPSVMLTLGEEHGGVIGRWLEGAVAFLLGETGATIVGVFGIVAGSLLLTGASAGALLRRTGHAVHRAGATARRDMPRQPPRLPTLAEQPPPVLAPKPSPPVDAEQAF